MKLSLILPSLFPAAMRRTIDNLHATTRGVDYEILAVTPFEVTGPNVRWIREEAPKGAVHAHIMAHERMSGDILVALSDDVLLADNWAQIALANLESRSRPSIPFGLGLHQSNFILGTVFGIYYPFFIVVRKAVLDAIGCYNDGTYVAHFADVDLGLRIWHAGGRCERTDLPLISRVPRQGREDVDPVTKSSNALVIQDTRHFTGRWAQIYGRGWPIESYEDFNLDVDALFEAVVGEDWSIFLNDPVFKRLLANYGRNAARWNLSGPGISPPKTAG